MESVLEKAEEARRNVKNRRIKLHLSKTTEDLRDTTTETSNRDRRKKTLERLSKYKERGEFPVNISHRGRTPLFIGENGNLCAVGFLMKEDGEEKLAERIHEENNEIRIENLNKDSEAAEWIRGSGLTVDEAARIQPSYPHMVTLASNCGPVSCKTMMLILSLVSSALLLKLEEIAWKYSKSMYPDKPLKRGGFLAGASALNISTAATLVFIAYVLLP